MSAPQRRIAVVGGGIGGLTAAGLLAREGHAVTLYEGTQHLGGKAQAVTLGGLTLDLGPTLLTLPHLVRATFEQLGALDLLPAFTELEPQCRYHFADGCGFTAWRDLEKSAESAWELRPSEARGIHSFYAEAAALYRATRAMKPAIPSKGASR